MIFEPEWEIVITTKIGAIKISGKKHYIERIQLPCFKSDYLKNKIPPPSKELKNKLKKALFDWFNGYEEELRDFPHKISGTKFQQMVWMEVKKIPRGTTSTYKEISIKVTGSPKSARAVGGALKANPLPLLIPCHRVISASGTLGGFGGSKKGALEIKKELLRMEGIKWER